MSFKWLDVAKQIQAIAQAGITFTENKYDVERYEQLRELSVKILTEFSDGDETHITDIFATEKGYQTPKVDVRGVVIRDNKILMVKETIDGKWSLPGGWCDVGLSAKENCEKEVFEEAGLKVTATKLLAVFDKHHHNHPQDIYHAYKLFFLCEEIGGKINIGMETSEVEFFNLNELPPLSIERNTDFQIKKAFEIALDSSHPTVFD